MAATLTLPTINTHRVYFRTFGGGKIANGAGPGAKTAPKCRTNPLAPVGGDMAAAPGSERALEKVEVRIGIGEISMTTMAYQPPIRG